MKTYDFEIEIQTSKRRKTLSMQVVENRLKILIPLGIADSQIESFIDKNLDWIYRRIAKNKNNKQVEKSYTDGEVWNLFNKELSLKIQLGSKKAVALREDLSQILISLDERSFFSTDKSKIVKKILLDWLDADLISKIEKLCLRYAQKIDVSFKSLTIKNYKSMWGLCRSGNLSFNRKLVFAPKWILEYVIVHEVCHLKHPHHQKTFWSEVATLYPQYKAAKQWLKLKGELLIKIEF